MIQTLWVLRPAGAGLIREISEYAFTAQTMREVSAFVNWAEQIAGVGGAS
jgi:hypothetical protein